MIQKHSDDPDVAYAATKAFQIIDETISKLPQAQSFDYGGHIIELNEDGGCSTCTTPIAEAQAAYSALNAEAARTADGTIREHIQMAAKFFQLEAEAATVRADLHNGHGSEPIIERLLGYQFERGIHDDYQHNHGKTN